MEESMLDLSEKVKRLCEENKKLADETSDIVLEAFQNLIPKREKNND
ncbi:MAG: hypothetical protein LBT79_07350 [Elusimicrobiota bacterium]|jgi:uncharacterized protein (UPF0335 family)|nr:hypothetical protein [Elusimicrobiota bacterium]